MENNTNTISSNIATKVAANTATTNLNNYITSITAKDPSFTTIPTSTVWSSSYYNSTTDYYIGKAIEKLPTIIQIKSYQKEGNILNIKYNIILDKFLPESGTLYIYNTNIYGIFNETDDKYWYKKLNLTCDIKDLDKTLSKKPRMKYAILLNDYNIKLSNEEIEDLADPVKYKNFAHLTLENILKSEGFDLNSKNIKLGIHNSLESKMLNLYE